MSCSTGRWPRALTPRRAAVLVATGRRPNTDDLGLAAAGTAADSQGFITVDNQCRTNVPGVWALGECNGHGAFTNTAYNDFEIVAANLFDNDPRRLSDRIPGYALYMDPPCGLQKRYARYSARAFSIRRSGTSHMSATAT